MYMGDCSFRMTFMGYFTWCSLEILDVELTEDWFTIIHVIVLTWHSCIWDFPYYHAHEGFYMTVQERFFNIFMTNCVLDSWEKKTL